jgi:hypothetical protein
MSGVMEKTDKLSELSELLKGARVCFCTLCSHQKEFGHCYFCSCHNHTPQPQLGIESHKILAALDHSRELLKSLHFEIKNSEQKR